MDKKYTLTIRMDGKTEQEIREKMDDAHVRSLNAFVLKAIDFYLGYLRQGKNLNYCGATQPAHWLENQSYIVVYSNL